ncbi:MAG: hypothetical protein ILP16_02535 [Spirochaetales bacterium]|nr:hypothetical protein [Spirochaetales bacterium]
MEVTIPTHPWEKTSGKSLWYTLKWTYGDEIRSAYISPDQRTITLYIPPGETAIIAAYPLGDMSPFGAILTPLDTSYHVVLSQNDGVLAGELLDIDRVVTSRLNYGLISSGLHEKTDDFRKIDKVSFLRDLQNGVLSKTSFRIISPFGVDSFALPNGIWTSEFLQDPGLVVTEGKSPDLQLPEGVFRYLNPDMERVLVLIVDSSGAAYSYLRQSLV